MRITTKLRYQRKVKIDRIVKKTLEFCIATWGINGRKSNELCYTVLYEYAKDNSFGQYIVTENLIEINIKEHKNIKELIDTVIHEHIHHTQSMKEYYKYPNYYNNPLEKEAVKLAKEYTPICWKEIKYLI